MKGELKPQYWGLKGQALGFLGGQVFDGSALDLKLSQDPFGGGGERWG